LSKAQQIEDDVAMPDVLRRLARGTPSSVQAWWCALTQAARVELTALWDVRAEHVAYASSLTERGMWRRAPIHLAAVEVDPEMASENAMWLETLTEYLQADPERTLHLRERTFHICRSHPPCARGAVARTDPATFRVSAGSQTVSPRPRNGFVSPRRARARPGAGAAKARPLSGLTRLIVGKSVGQH